MNYNEYNDPTNYSLSGRKTMKRVIDGITIDTEADVIRIGLPYKLDSWVISSADAVILCDVLQEAAAEIRKLYMERVRSNPLQTTMGL